MKGFFKLLLVGLFLMTLGFVTETQITSIDDDVGTYISQDIQDCSATFENTEIETRLNYSEVGIVSDSKLMCISSTSNFTDRNEILQGSLFGNLNPIRDLASICNVGKMNNLVASSNSYKTQKRKLNYDIHFRLGRSRMVLNGEYVMQTINT